MRSTLNELPIFVTCLWGGVISGLVCAVLRLPRLLYSRSRRGRREGLLAMALLCIADVIAALAAAITFSAVLVYANGGELRLYAVTAFAAGMCVPMLAAERIVIK